MLLDCLCRLSLFLRLRSLYILLLAFFGIAGCGGGGSTPSTAPTLPVIASFTASPSTITAGQSSTLSWGVTGATSVTLSGTSGSATSPVTVTPGSTTTYTLTATNSAGSSTATAVVTVNVPPPVISSFTVSPATITAGQSSTLSWSVTGATSVIVSGVSGAAVSPLTVTPAATTTYTLTATNAGGSMTATASITVNPAPTTFTLSVVDGFGSGTYPAGTNVDVLANPAGSGAAFNLWTGDTKYLVDANSYHTTLTAPAGSSLTVTANYTLGVPVVSPTVAQVPGTNTGTSANRVTTPSPIISPITIGYEIPASHPKGIIFEFHGTGGSYIDWFVQTDNVAFNAEALAAGYGIVVVDSAATGYWDYKTTYPNNLDFQNVQATRNYLIGLGVMSSFDKLYGLGVSDGGYFESAVSRALAFNASALGIAGGLLQYFDPSVNIPTINGISHQLTPTIFLMEQQDGTSGVSNGSLYPAVIGIGPSGIEQGYCNAAELETLTNPAPVCNTTITPNPYPASVPNINFYMNPPSPAYPARFAQLTDVSTSTALAIDTWMQSQGCIDANGRILANPYQSVDSNAATINFKCSQTPLVAQFGAAPYNLTTSQANRLMDEFIIAYSEHKFMAEFNEKVLAFFAAH